MALIQSTQSGFEKLKGKRTLFQENILLLELGPSVIQSNFFFPNARLTCTDLYRHTDTTIISLDLQRGVVATTSDLHLAGHSRYSGFCPMLPWEVTPIRSIQWSQHSRQRSSLSHIKCPLMCHSSSVSTWLLFFKSILRYSLLTLIFKIIKSVVLYNI